MEPRNAIIRPDQEGQPAYIEYFNSMNDLFGTMPTDHRGYQNILVYDRQSDQPVMILLRLVSNFTDGAIGYQDEIEVMDKSKLPTGSDHTRLQLNFEVGTNGDLIKYPSSPQFSGYMQVAVGEVSRCSTKAGATIRINNRVGYVSDGTKWNIPQPITPTPVLPKSSPLLSNG